MKAWSIGLAICLGAALLAPCAHGAAVFEPDRADCEDAACDSHLPVAGDCDVCEVSSLPAAMPLNLVAAGNAPAVVLAAARDRLPSTDALPRRAPGVAALRRSPHLHVMDVVRLLI